MDHYYFKLNCGSNAEMRKIIDMIKPIKMKIEIDVTKNLYLLSVPHLPFPHLYENLLSCGQSNASNSGKLPTG